MNADLRKVQLKILKMFFAHAKGFALSGGTALELYYLRHRFSADLDFFSPKYSQNEIDSIVGRLKESFGSRMVKMESEFRAPGRARVKFYSVKAKGLIRPLKLDFVEDVVFAHPKIRNFGGVRVYDVKNIYVQKVLAITGGSAISDDIGRQFTQGRKEARDIFDLYLLSKKIQPLHVFFRNVPGQLRRGIVHWYRTFSRQDLKISLLDLDIYDKKFNVHDLIKHLESEVRQIIEEALK